MPRSRIENLQGSRRLAAPPLSHWAPAALAAAPRQGFLGPFGPRASKSVTTHFRGGQMNPHLRRAPRPRNALPMLSVCREWPLGFPPRARETRVSCGPHAILRHRSVARSQASSAFRAKPTKFQPFPPERPKPCETPSLSGAPRGEGKPRFMADDLREVGEERRVEKCPSALHCFRAPQTYTKRKGVPSRGCEGHCRAFELKWLATLTCAAACGLSPRGVTSSMICQKSPGSACTSSCGRRSMPSASFAAPPGGTLRWGGGGA